MFLTITLFWAAHVYAQLLGDWATTGNPPDRSRWAAEMKHQWPMVGVCTVPALFLIAGITDLIPDGAALYGALIVCTTELALAGFIAARRGGGGVVACVLSAAVAFTFGVTLIILKAILH